jgi:hypothetical protein
MTALWDIPPFLKYTNISEVLTASITIALMMEAVQGFRRI